VKNNFDYDFSLNVLLLFSALECRIFKDERIAQAFTTFGRFFVLRRIALKHRPSSHCPIILNIHYPIGFEIICGEVSHSPRFVLRLVEVVC
jgi:hypothetical protein